MNLTARICQHKAVLQPAVSAASKQQAGSNKQGQDIKLQQLAKAAG